MNERILLCVRANKEHYLDAVSLSGGKPAAVYCPSENMNIDEFDGLILCGGNDLDPHFYGEEIHESEDIDRARDDAEFALLKRFLKTGKPVMGICRGFQMLNVYFGGDLHQQITEVSNHRGSLEHYPVHSVRASRDSFLARIYGEEFSVNSCHHQGVKTLGKGLRAIAACGALVEAFEHETLPVFGVQWHPEKMCYGLKREDAVDGAPIFTDFLKRCQRKGV